MKQFSVEEYQKNPNRKVITRDGRSVRIVCTDVMGAIYPVLAVYKKDPTHEYWNSYTTDGKLYTEIDTDCDLFFAPEKKKGWVNLYKFNSVTIPGTKVYDTEEEAKFEIGNKFENYISTKKIEWEE